MFDQSNKSSAIDVEMDGSVFEEKSSFKRLIVSIAKTLLSIAKTVSKKSEVFIQSIKFLCLEAALISINLPYDLSCHAMPCHADATSYCLDMLGQLQKQVFRTAGRTLAASLEPFCHNISLFCKYYFGRCLSELAELFVLPYSPVKSYVCCDRWHDFLAKPFLDLIKISVLTVSFLTQLYSGILCLQNAFF